MSNKPDDGRWIPFEISINLTTSCNSICNYAYHIENGREYVIKKQTYLKNKLIKKVFFAWNLLNSTKIFKVQTRFSKLSTLKLFKT